MRSLFISILVFVGYSPISVILRNIANVEVNNKKEIWDINNNKKMMKMLKSKNKKMYYLMHIEHLVLLQLIVGIIFLIV